MTQPKEGVSQVWMRCAMTHLNSGVALLEQWLRGRL